MNINYLIFRNLKKNLKNYYLYVFALVFSVALYFAFVTLQYDPAMDEIKGSVKGAAGLSAASVLLVVIVAVFLLYANNIFIKRRGKEIGLFQLVGLTKGKIFRILSSENLILYFGSMLIGIFLGFASSRLLLMVLFKIIGVNAQASLNFSVQALVQTVIVFAAIYLLIMLMNYSFIKRQSILSLFRVVSTTENTVRRMTLSQVIIGFLGISLILFGYYVSTKLFSGAFVKMNELFLAMVLILGSVIVGTYLFYKGSVSFIFNMIRKSKGGYLSLNEVLSLSSIMFRMKSNALLLTIITTVSALAIGLLSLSYISYYSAEESSRQTAPNHFTLLEEKDVTAFTAGLRKEGIDYTEIRRDVIMMDAGVSHMIGASVAEESDGIIPLPIVDEKSVAGTEVSPEEAMFTGSNDAMKQFMGIQSTGDLELKGRTQSFPLHVKGLNKESVISLYFSKGAPTLVVDHSVFERLAQEKVPELQRSAGMYIGIDIAEPNKLARANEIFMDMKVDDQPGYVSLLNDIAVQKSNMGLIMFIVAFLGLTFLITSGCILYFKQMGEGEEEKPSYTILRKLGFTQGNLVRGIQFKQMFSFGIPLVVGLSHSYFAVQSGWFFFGTELWTPMFLVMLLYTLLYSIFGILSLFFYKRIIKESL